MMFVRIAKRLRPAPSAALPCRHSTNDRLRGPLALLLLASNLQAADIPVATDACLPGLTETTPSAEFTVVGNGEVVRHERTNLEWQRCALGQTWRTDACAGKPSQYTWHQATQVASSSGAEWRLPSADELQSIVEHCHPGPAINPQVFPNTPGIFFWTASSDTGGLDRAWSISFFAGSHYRSGKDQDAAIRLVRDTPRASNEPAPPGR